jgi:hypothetical protein
LRKQGFGCVQVAKISHGTFKNYIIVWVSCASLEKFSSILMRLRSAVGERGSGAENGEKRLAERKPERNVAAEPQTEARRFCGQHHCRS